MAAAPTGGWQAAKSDVEDCDVSLMTQAFLIETYGPRLGIEHLSKVLGFAPNTIYNQVAKKVFPIATYLDAGQRWADYRDVAQYLDDCRARATTPA
jgi:predicted DNA-binding transcriptional regulator AlpA